MKDSIFWEVITTTKWRLVSRSNLPFSSSEKTNTLSAEVHCCLLSLSIKSGRVLSSLSFSLNLLFDTDDLCGRPFPRETLTYNVAEQSQLKQPNHFLRQLLVRAQSYSMEAVYLQQVTCGPFKQLKFTWRISPSAHAFALLIPGRAFLGKCALFTVVEFPAAA